MTTTQQTYDERVAALDDQAFIDMAWLMVSALRGGEGLRAYFEPGDATRYYVSIEPRDTYIVSAHKPAEVKPAPLCDLAVTFGTDTGRATMPYGHAHRLDKQAGVHDWTAAVWRRLWAMVQEAIR